MSKLQNAIMVDQLIPKSFEVYARSDDNTFDVFARNGNKAMYMKNFKTEKEAKEFVELFSAGYANTMKSFK